MSRQNPFMRSTGDRFCNNCQNGGQNNCNDQQSCCDESDCCHDNDKNPCIICPPGPEGPQGDAGPIGPQGPIGATGPKVHKVPPVRKVLSVPQEHRDRRGFPEAYSVMQIFMH